MRARSAANLSSGIAAATDPVVLASAAMEAVQKDLMAMKVAELKEELEARGEAKTGNKAWLRRRLHSAIIRDHLADK